MAAEALIVEDAYQRGYADAIADMRKKKEQRRQREQAKKARRWYFIKQKAYGLAMLAVYIELKAGENTTTKKQKEWLEYLRQQGYYTAVCYGWQPAAQLIEQYLLHSDELTKEQETVTMR